MQKADKDLSLEQTIKTYEEIWLSKVFNLKLYKMVRPDSDGKVLNEEEDNNTNDRRSSISKLMNKSGKRRSIVSLPQSLLDAEPVSVNFSVRFIKKRFEEWN